MARPEPTPTHELSLIALHGLAASEAEVDQLALPLAAGFPARGVRWIFPKAKKRPVSMLGGRAALAWYDVRQVGRGRIDEEGIREASAMLRGYVANERARGVPAERIVLLGFSQGGMLALHAGLRMRPALGGVVALSAALPLLEGIPHAAPGAPPVFVGHGLFDTCVPYSYAGETQRVLTRHGYDVELRSYPVGHWITRGELLAIARWLEGRVLPALRSSALDRRVPLAPAALAS